MKTTHPARAVLLVWGVAVFVPPVPAAWADAPRVQQATVLRVRGDVSIRPPGGRWRVPNERERIRPGTEIQTGPDGEVILRLSERNLVRIGPGSSFRLDAATVERRPGARVGPFRGEVREYDFRVDLDEGTATSILRGLEGASTFEMRTPVAVAGVRGTIFSAKVTRGRGGAPGERSGNANLGTGKTPSDVASENSNVGAGNRGQGVGNTGPGNQGEGPNATTAGNAGGEAVTAEFVCIEGAIEVMAAGAAAPVFVEPGMRLEVTGAPVSQGAAAGGPGTGEAGAQAATATATATAEAAGEEAASLEAEAVSTVHTEATITEAAPNEIVAVTETIALPTVQAEIQLGVGVHGGGLCGN